MDLPNHSMQSDSPGPIRFLGRMQSIHPETIQSHDSLEVQQPVTSIGLDLPTRTQSRRGSDRAS